MVQHAALTGADLHEPKGADSASINTVYVANGSGSGAWSKIDADNIDTSSIFNTNKGKLVVEFPDIGTAGSIYIPFSTDATITRITTVVETAPLTTDTILTAYNFGGSSMGTITIAYSGATAGDMDYLIPVANNTVQGDQYIRIASDGAASNSVRAIIMIDFTYSE